MQFNQMNNSTIEKMQSQCMPKKSKKMQPVMQPVKKFRCHKYNPKCKHKRNQNVNI